jgi:hypothetical protein
VAVGTWEEIAGVSEQTARHRDPTGMAPELSCVGSAAGQPDETFT